MSSGHSESEIKKTIPFIIASKRMGYAEDDSLDVRLVLSRPIRRPEVSTRWTLNRFENQPQPSREVRRIKIRALDDNNKSWISYLKCIDVIETKPGLFLTEPRELRLH